MLKERLVRLKPAQPDFTRVLRKSTRNTKLLTNIVHLYVLFSTVVFGVVMKHSSRPVTAEDKVQGQAGRLGLTETLDALRGQLNQLTRQVHGIGDETGVTPQQVRSILQARICRNDFLKAALFAEPAWDMLLELFARELEHQRISVSQLCRASAVPETTAHRWIDNLDREGLIIRSADAFDGRRVWVTLSPEGSAAMQRYFEALPVRFLPR